MRAKLVLKTGRRRTLCYDAGGEAGRVHDRYGWRPNEVYSHVGERAEIGAGASRIAGKILMRRKLCGVDEDRDDDARCTPLRSPHQREVTGMEGAHGRYQRNALAGRSPPTDGAAQCRHRTHDSNGHLGKVRLLGTAALRTNYQRRGWEAMRRLTCAAVPSRDAVGHCTAARIWPP